MGDTCLVIHHHSRPVNIYGYDPKNGHGSPETVVDAVAYDYLHSGQKHQENHLLCPIQCYLNDLHIREVPKLLADYPSETNHATQVINLLDAAHPLIILLPVILMFTPQVLQHMRMRKFQRFISL